RRRRNRQADAGDDPLRDLAAECPAPLAEVLDLLGVRARVVVRRSDDLVVRDRQLQPIAEDPELRLVELLRLMGDVPGLDTAPERPALDRLGEDDRRGPLRLGRGLVRGVELAVVVAAAPELREVVVREALDPLAEAW